MCSGHGGEAMKQIAVSDFSGDIAMDKRQIY